MTSEECTKKQPCTGHDDGIESCLNEPIRHERAPISWKNTLRPRENNVYACSEAGACKQVRQHGAWSDMGQYTRPPMAPDVAIRGRSS